MRRVLDLFAVLLLGFAAPALAQLQAGSILVKAMDEQGAVAPGVTVTISSPVLVAGSMSGVTDAGGAYRFPALQPGSYNVKLELQGFQTIVREGVVVSAGQTTPIDLSMKVATVSETVTVKGESPVVDTTSANVNVHLDAKLLETTPSGRDIWSIIEYKAPGIVMATPDVGGNQGGLQRGLSSRGTSNSQNTQMLNGVNVGDPAAIGFAGYYYDPSAFEDIQVASGAQDITVPSSGVFINMVTKSGSNYFSGSALGTYQGSKTQWDNIDDTLKAKGLRPNANGVKFITNGNFNAGGPIAKNKLFYFASFNDQRTHVNYVGFPAPVWTGAAEQDATDITSIFADASYQPVSRHKFTTTLSRQLYDKPNRGASTAQNAPLTPESTFHERDILSVYQGLWNWVVSDRMFANTSLSYNTIDFPLNLKTDKQTLLDLTTQTRTRAAANQPIMWRRRVEFVSNWQYFIPQFAGGRHEIRFGLDNAYTPETVTTTINGDLRLTYRTLPSGTTPAGPAQVQLFNTPLVAKRAVQGTAVYAQDQYSINRLTIIGGVRWERVEGWVPAQQDPASQWFTEGSVVPLSTYTVQRSFPEVRNIPLWKNAAGRFNAVYDLTGDGRTAVKGSIGRYYDVIGTGTPGQLNPNGTIQQNYVWNDKNGDLLFQPGELGTASAPTIPLTLDQLKNTRSSNFNRPYRHEWTLGVDREIIPALRGSITFIHRQEHAQLATVEVKVPFDYYTPVQKTDPGRDGQSGTADDQTVTLYNENLPNIASQTQQGNDDRLDQRYNGIELSVSKRYSNHWAMVAGYTFSRTKVDCCTFNGTNTTSVTSPNSFINASGLAGIDRAHNFKVTGSYLLPWDLQFGGNFRLLSGEPITRNFGFSGLSQSGTGTLTVNVEPRGSLILDWVPTIDLRIGKILRIGRNQLEADLDVYNVTNANTVFGVRTGTGPQLVRPAGDLTQPFITIPQFLSPTDVLGPRIIRFNLVYRFGGSNASATLDRDRAVGQ